MSCLFLFVGEMFGLSKHDKITKEAHDRGSILTEYARVVFGGRWIYTTVCNGYEECGYASVVLIRPDEEDNKLPSQEDLTRLAKPLGLEFHFTGKEEHSGRAFAAFRMVLTKQNE